jgi:hypothetical protein
MSLAPSASTPRGSRSPSAQAAIALDQPSERTAWLSPATACDQICQPSRHLRTVSSLSLRRASAAFDSARILERAERLGDYRARRRPRRQRRLERVVVPARPGSARRASSVLGLRLLSKRIGPNPSGLDEAERLASLTLVLVLELG